MISQNHLASLLPGALAQLFHREARASSIATSASQRLQKWFDHSGLPFFPHYTDHTFEHVLSVIRAAGELVSGSAHGTISGPDVSFLIMACGCHDAGMHLTERQFKKLVSDNHEAVASSLDSATWAVLWEQFLSEARRFNERQLVSIFGSPQPVRPLPDDPADYSNRDRLLVGEFLRRHHPRLAHEIARGLDVSLGLDRTLEGLTPSEADLVGLIARSHGLSLREHFEYINKNFHLRDFQGIHIVFIMVLLRIADLAQLQSARAPDIHGKLHEIRSPLSAREWRVHQAVRNITDATEDPEAIYVDASPASIVDFLRTKEWLTQLQRELDVSWAVLGEVYGRYKSPPLQALTIKLRRVRSNILDGAAHLPFLPRAFAFKVAEAEMLSLLLAPLYGDNPLYGVRELVQNARDATLEVPKTAVPSDSPPRVRVVIDQRPEHLEVTITDVGIGMSADVIESYFLTAGASYRTSDDWKAVHEDEAGHSDILRSGRFGVGALAAFLVGDVLTVTTRHIESTLGLQFSCRLHDNEIEIHPTVCPAGTEIKIKSDAVRLKVIRKFSEKFADLFPFTDVDVSFLFIDDDGSEHYATRPKSEKLPTITYNFNTSRYPRVACHFYPRPAYFYRTSGSAAFVNGIAIASFDDDGLRFGATPYQFRDLTVPLSFPFRPHYNETMLQHRIRIFIDDPDAMISLNLARTSITRHDAEITDLIDRKLYELYREELQSWSDTALAPAAEHKGNFGLKLRNVLFFQGIAYPNDKEVCKKVGLTRFVRVDMKAKELAELSAAFPTVGFAGGAIPTSSHAELMEFFRDHASANKDSGSVVIVTGELEKSITRLKAPNWLLASIKRTGSPSGERNPLRLSFTEVEPKFAELVEDIVRVIGERPAEFFWSSDQKFEWHRHGVIERKSVFGSHWE